MKVGNFFILAGPSGSGKTTLIRECLKRFPDKIVHPLTYTTRKQRPGELNGRDMYFVSRSQFSPRMPDMLATTEYGGEYYGTLKSDILGPVREGKKAIVAFDEAGIDCVRLADFPAVTVWLAPPSRARLASWLRERWPNGGPEYERRLEIAYGEMENFENDRRFREKFDYWILSKEANAMADEMLEIMGLHGRPKEAI